MSVNSGFVSAKVSGLRTLSKALEDMGADLGDLRKLNLRVAIVVANAAVPLAPDVSGDLRVGMKARATKYRAKVGNLRRYAGAIHWGWPASSSKEPVASMTLDRPWFIRPQPFASQAAARTEPRWLAIYREGLQALCDQVAAKVYPGSP